MRASRSLDWTASNSSIILAAADVHVFLAYLWSTYLALMNSFLTVLKGRRGVQSAVWTFKSVFREYLSLVSTHMSLDGVGFGEGEERFPSMISLKLLFPTFLASWGRKKEKSASCISLLCPLLLVLIFHHKQK